MSMAGNIAISSYISQLIKLDEENKKLNMTEKARLDSLFKKMREDKEAADTGWL